MAVSYVSSATDASNPTTSFSVTIPTTQANDILTLDFTHGAAADGDAPGGTSGLTWTPKTRLDFNTAANSIMTYWARCTGDHAGTTVTVGGLTDSCVPTLSVYRGAHQTEDPIEDYTGEDNASADETMAEVTSTADGSMIVLVVAQATSFPTVSSQAATDPAALTERSEQASTGGTDCAISHASAEKTTAGATGSLTWAQANAATGSVAYVIRPAAAAAGVTVPVFDHIYRRRRAA